MSDAHRVSVTLLLAVLCGCGSLQQRRVARDCEDGAVEACVAAAVRQETELGPADFGWTPSWFRRKACDLRHWPSCLLVGLFAEERKED